MPQRFDFHRLDLLCFGVAVLLNLLLIGVFICRGRSWGRGEYILGLVAVAMVLPLLLVVWHNLVAKREWWSFILPLPMIGFLLLEFILDDLANINFRASGFLLLYIIIYYLGLFGLIGYSFLLGKIYGWIMLVVSSLLPQTVVKQRKTAILMLRTIQPGRRFEFLCETGTATGSWFKNRIDLG